MTNGQHRCRLLATRGAARPAVFDQHYVKRLEGPNVKKGKTKRDLAEAIISADNNLIRDLTADAYGGWQFVVALQAGGGLNAQRIMMHRTYNMAAAKAKALAAAGVTAH